jgi:hypothetical protein
MLTAQGASVVSAAVSVGQAFARNRGIVCVTQGEQAILAGTWSTATPSTCRLFAGDPTLELTDAQRNALTEADLTEASFTGYSGVPLTQANWTVTPGTPSSAEHTEVSFAATANPASPLTFYGYYVTRDSDGALIYYDVWVDGPYPIEADTDAVSFLPAITLGVTL